MKKKFIGISVIFLYCFPFVFFSMYQDFEYRSMRGYLLMIIATSILAFFGKFFCNFTPIILGNIVSGIVSFYFSSKMAGIGNWDFYFEPFTPSMLLIIVTVLNLIPQFLAVALANGFKLFAIELLNKFKNKTKN